MNHELFMFIQAKLEAKRLGILDGISLSLTNEWLTITKGVKTYKINPETLECTTNIDTVSWMTTNEAIYELFHVTLSEDGAPVVPEEVVSHDGMKLRLSRRFK